MNVIFMVVNLTYYVGVDGTIVDGTFAIWMMWVKNHNIICWWKKRIVYVTVLVVDVTFWYFW